MRQLHPARFLTFGVGFCGFVGFFFFVLFCFVIHLICMHHQQKGNTPPPALVAAEGWGERGTMTQPRGGLGTGQLWGSRGMLKGTYEGVTTFTCPALGLPHLCPCHTSSNPHIHSLHPRFPPSWALRPLLLPSILSSLPHQHCCLPPRPAPTFPEGHFVWPQPRGLPPRPEVLNSPPQAVASLQPQGRSPHTRPSPLGLVSLGRPG